MRRAEPDTARAPRLRLTNHGVLWLLVALVVGTVAWLKSINLVLLIVYVMVAMLLLNGVVAWLGVRGARAARIAMTPVFAGERVEGGATVSNSSRRPATVTVEDRVGELTTTFLAYRVPGRSTVGCVESREYPNRGRFEAAVTLASAFPFGFLRCERECEPGEVVVLPRPGAADADGLRRWVLRQAGASGRARKVLRRVTTDQAEVRGVRPYRPGDPIRSIHWRTTARRGELMVREYDSAPSPELVLVVEPWLPEKPTPADRDRLEAALSLATTVALAWRRAFDSPVTVVTLGAGSEVSPVLATAASEEAVRDALAPLAGVAGGPGAHLPPPAAFGRHLSRAARVVVSSRRDSPSAAALTRTTGKPFVAVSPAHRLPWYQPPVSLQAEA
jgi:uncharacterized protein (DUF58 family)